MTRPAALIGLAALLLGACSEGTVMVLNNETTCSFEKLEGIKVHPRTGDETVVFAMDRIDPADERPVYFDLDWEGILKVTAEVPPGFEKVFEVEPGMKGTELLLNPPGRLECNLRSPAEYQP
jgi:hypothetical protein